MFVGGPDKIRGYCHRVVNLDSETSTPLAAQRQAETFAVISCVSSRNYFLVLDKYGLECVHQSAESHTPILLDRYLPPATTTNDPDVSDWRLEEKRRWRNIFQLVVMDPSNASAHILTKYVVNMGATTLAANMNVRDLHWHVTPLRKGTDLELPYMPMAFSDVLQEHRMRVNDQSATLTRLTCNDRRPDAWVGVVEVFLFRCVRERNKMRLSFGELRMVSCHCWKQKECGSTFLS